MFQGQKVICIDDSGDKTDRPESFPVKDTVYTIRRDFGQTVLLEEIVNEPQAFIDGFREMRFRATRFRPVNDRPTDISVFTDLLTPGDSDKS